MVKAAIGLFSRAFMFGSCAKNGLLNVWDFEKASNNLFFCLFCAL